MVLESQQKKRLVTKTQSPETSRQKVIYNGNNSVPSRFLTAKKLLKAPLKVGSYVRPSDQPSVGWGLVSGRIRVFGLRVWDSNTASGGSFRRWLRRLSRRGYVGCWVSWRELRTQIS